MSLSFSLPVWSRICPPPQRFTARCEDTTDDPFSQPEKLSAITGFVEAATLSPDASTLYYHKKENDRFVIYRVVR